MRFAQRTAWNLAKNRLSGALEERQRSGLPVLDLTLSNPTECGFSYDSAAISAAFAQPAILRYCPEPLGLLGAREAVAAYYSGLGSQLSPAQILLTTGTSESYSFLFRLLGDPGDEILVASPSYPLFEFLSGIQDVRLIHYPLLYDHGWQIDLHTLERRISPRTKAIVLVHPNNPTGNYCRPEDSRHLLALCASRDLALIVDEVFLDFAVDGQPRPSFSAESNALTFTLGGISKLCGLPQMKFAWLAVTGPDHLCRDALARLEVIADAYLSLNTPVQIAAPALLATREAFQRQLLARSRENLRQLDRLLSEKSQCSRLAVQGGWNVVMRLPSSCTGDDLAVDLLAKEGVCVHPGHFYDFSSDSYLVLSLITPTATFVEGVNRLLHVV